MWDLHIEDSICNNKEKERLIGELQKMINGQFSDLAKIGQDSMDYSKLRFDDSSLSLNEIRSRFNTFIIYESDSNNWERQWSIMNDFCLGEYINYSAKEIYEKMIEDLHAGNFESENIYQVRKIDSKTFNIVDEYSKRTFDEKEI